MSDREMIEDAERIANKFPKTFAYLAGTERSMTTPSIQALNLAVKPAGYSSWREFEQRVEPYHTFIHTIALAYAADLDKADKQNRDVLALLEQLKMITQCSADLKAQAISILRANLLPDPQPTLLEEFAEAVPYYGGACYDFRNGVIAALDWITKRELEAKEQDRG